MQQPAVTAVEKNHLEAGQLNTLCGLGILFDGLEDNFLGHLRQVSAVQTGACLVTIGLDHGVGRCPNLMSLHVGLAGKHAGMHQFDGGDGAMLIDRVCNGGKVRNAIIVVKLQILGDIHAVDGVNVSLAHMDNGAAAAGLAFIVGHQRLGGNVLDGQVAIAGGCGKNSVAQDGVSQLQGLKKIGILALVHIFLSFRWST